MMSNEEHLDTLNPQKRQSFIDFINECSEKGIKVIITQSYRSLTTQYRLHLKDKRNAVPGLSAHQYGFAIDINIIKDGKHYKMSNTQGEWISTGVVEIAKKHGLRWGGTFAGYADVVHFDCLKPGDTTRFLNYLKQTYGANYVNINANEITWKL